MPIGLKMEFSVGGQTDQGGVLRKLGLAFERAGLNLKEFGRYVWPGLTEAMEAIEKEQFDAEGMGEVASHWAPLTLRYEKEKAKRYPGAPILVRRGNLRAAFTESASPFAARAESDAEMVFGTQGLEYASFHQSGTKYMVPRPPVDFGPDFEELARQKVAEGVRKAIQDADPQNLLEVQRGRDE